MSVDDRTESTRLSLPRRRRVRAFLYGLGVVVLTAAIALGAVAVPTLGMLLPADLHGRVVAMLLLVLAPGILLAAGCALMFGLSIGWPRSRLASNAVMIGVASTFVGLWALPALGLDEQGTGYVVVGGAVGLTFVLAPALVGMLITGREPSHPE